jgi:hypothetical protein
VDQFTTAKELHRLLFDAYDEASVCGLDAEAGACFCGRFQKGFHREYA